MKTLRIITALCAAMLVSLNASAQPDPNDTGIVIMMDSSGSLGQIGWDNEVLFVNELLGSSVLTDANVGIVQFSDPQDTSIIWDFADSQVKAAIQSQVSNMTYTGGYTDTVSALQLSIQMFQSAQVFANRVNILISDGNPTLPNGGDVDICAYAPQLFSQDIRTIVIGIGRELSSSIFDCILDDHDEDFILIEEASLAALQSRIYLDANGDGIPDHQEGLGTAPVANAGNDQNVLDSVDLDGSASTDSDGTIVSYEWALTDLFDNSLHGTATGAAVSFSGLQYGSYMAQLWVTDDDGFTDTDSIVINAYGDISSDVQQQIDDAVAVANDAKDAEIDALIVEHEAAIAALETQVADLEASIALLETQNSELETTVADLEQERDALLQTIADLETQITALEAAIAANEAAIASLTTENSAQIAQLQTQNADLQAQIAGLQSTISGLEANIASLSAQLNARTAQLAQAQASIAALQQANAQLEAQKATLLQANEQLAADYASLSAQNAGLNAALVNLQLQLDEQALTIADLEALLDAAGSGAGEFIEDIQLLIAAEFNAPNFLVPGSTVDEQVDAILLAISELNHGQQQALFRNLDGEKGGGKSKKSNKSEKSTKSKKSKK